MKPLTHNAPYRLRHPSYGWGDDYNGFFVFPIRRNREGIQTASIITLDLERLRVLASNGEGWDHVSVSLENRTPTWEEMDFIKRKFFYPEETVMQIHPPEAMHVNLMPYCLHLWRPHKIDIPLPPVGML